LLSVSLFVISNVINTSDIMTMNKPDPRPALRTNWFHILLAVAEDDLHGSAIVRDILEQTGGSLRIWPATLYRTIDDLVEAGLIADVTDSISREVPTGRRRFYGITGRGRSELFAALTQMSSWADLGRRRLASVAP